VSVSPARPEASGCSAWTQQNWYGAWYWVYGCFWGEDTLPGAQIGVFDACSVYYELYYWIGNDASGRPIPRFFQSGNTRWC